MTQDHVMCYNTKYLVTCALNKNIQGVILWSFKKLSAFGGRAFLIAVPENSGLLGVCSGSLGMFVMGL